MFLIAADYWPITLLALAAGGFWLGRVKRRRLRYAGVVALVLAPVLALFLEGLWTGCALRIGGAECMWYGFGMVIAVIYFLPVSAIATATGLLLRRLASSDSARNFR